MVLVIPSGTNDLNQLIFTCKRSIAFTSFIEWPETTWVLPFPLFLEMLSFVSVSYNSFSPHIVFVSGGFSAPGGQDCFMPTC